MPEDDAPLARLLLRAEGIASSYVEGVSAPVVDVVLAEPDLSRQRGAAAWVAANPQATADAVAHASGTEPLRASDRCSWHVALVAGSQTPAEQVGHVRTEPGWIGGTSPLDAHLVTAPVAELDTLLADLLELTNRTDVDPVAQDGLAHAQFEVVHPFADGNGRIGRVLILWLLTRRLRLRTPPPVSVLPAADVGSSGASRGCTRGVVVTRDGVVVAELAPAARTPIDPATCRAAVLVTLRRPARRHHADRERTIMSDSAPAMATSWVRVACW